jgi:hypothetical protein
MFNCLEVIATFCCFHVGFYRKLQYYQSDIDFIRIDDDDDDDDD